MKKMKKILSVLCVLAVLLSYLDTSIIWSAYAENTETENTEAAKELIAPQNLHEENGFIIWDETPDAYGYSVKACRDDLEINTVYYTNSVELKRFFYENNMEFDEYRFEVCAFDETNTMGEYSNPVTITYAPTLDTPANVRLSEDGKRILADEVAGAVRYNVRVFKEDGTLRYQDWIKKGEGISIVYKDFLQESGNFLFAFQAMDNDYNVSEWTEHILVKHTIPQAPKNVRLDQSGDKVIWDEVEGATKYYIMAYVNYGNGNSVGVGDYTTQPYYNWKSFMRPFSDGKYEIRVWAYNEEDVRSDGSDSLRINFHPLCDEAIQVPENIRLEDNSFIQWDTIEDADRYWLCIQANGELIYCNETFDADYGVYIGNIKLPSGTYEAKLYVIDKNNNYNSKLYSFTLNTVVDETVWIPEIKYKFDKFLWDWDELRNDLDGISFYWACVKKDDTIIMLRDLGRINEFYLPENMEDGDYTIEVCVYKIGKIGKWSEPLKISKHGEGLFDKENEVSTEVEPSPDAGQIPEDDRITTITINPAFNMKNKHDNNVEIDLSKIKIKAKEIYDEEGLKRASEALGEKIAGNKHYNLLDLTLFEGDRDISNGYEGLVQVIIPLPKGHRNKKFSCYRLIEVNGKMTKEEIPGEQTEDSYIIYLEHFSEYALIADEHTHAYGESLKSDKNSHWKECECSARSEEEEHTYGDWKIVREATESEEGVKERNCEKCGYKVTETIPKKSYTHTHDYEEICKFDENSHWKECECGERTEEEEHIYGAWKTIREATENEEGIRERSCNVCGYKQTGNLPKLIVSTPSESNKFDDKLNEKPDDKLKEIPKPDNQNPDTGDCLLDTSYSVLLICCSVITLLAKKRSLKEKYTNK